MLERLTERHEEESMIRDENSYKVRNLILRAFLPFIITDSRVIKRINNH